MSETWSKRGRWKILRIRSIFTTTWKVSGESIVGNGKYREESREKDGGSFSSSNVV